MYTRISGLSASLAPGHDSVLDGAGTSAGEEGTTRIALTRVNASCKMKQIDDNNYKVYN
jgi:hypothetical protein